jgi:hypothetical protein
MNNNITSFSIDEIRAVGKVNSERRKTMSPDERKKEERNTLIWLEAKLNKPIVIYDDNTQK